MSAIRFPLWSLYGEYYVSESATISTVTMLLLSCVRWMKVFAMA